MRNKEINIEKKLTDVLRVLVYQILIEVFYEKKKILTSFYIFYKSEII